MLRKFGLLLLVGLLLAGCQTPLERLATSPYAAKTLPVQGGFFYRITKPATNQDFYLFGTIHHTELDAQKKPQMPLRRSVLQALLRSDHLIVEIYDFSVAPPSEAPTQDKPKDEVLEKLITQGADFFRKTYEYCGLSPQSVEGHLIYLARRQKMPIAGLETLADRTRVVMNAHPDTENSPQYKNLKAMDILDKYDLAELEKKNGKEKMHAALCQGRADIWEQWIRQDIAGMKQLAHAGTGDALNQAIGSERSKLFYARIQEQLQKGGRPFIAVGSAHLYDQEGLVARFEAEGYTVRWIAK